jgi:hypothetical protein
MPIEYRIDHTRRLVIARGVGAFSGDDVFRYQRDVWSQPDVAGYDELVDMTDVTSIPPVPGGFRMKQLAKEAAARDDQAATAKFAIVAPSPLAFGLGRQYQAYRELESQSKKQVGVFRTMADALAFLGIESLESSEPNS